MTDFKAALVKDCWQNLLDKDDRTSPEDYPDHCLITKAELSQYLYLAFATQADGWRDIVSCSTLDGVTVELYLPDHSVVKGNFDKHRGCWIMQSDPIPQEQLSPFKNPVTGERATIKSTLTVHQPLPANVYPTHWRPLVAA